uniref:Zinc/cadmium resistance protein-like n=1 Tax=Sinocyclocheilus grahami TaxID=75366 RepID=A0A672RKN2_SINGR
MARISGSTRICTLVLTLCFLVFEIVVGQICRSLLIAVDSFHTLYIFINLALSALNPPCAEDYRRMRLKPFGNLISALLMASQCVSISLEILTHVVQPEPILHPLLSIVVGGVVNRWYMLLLKPSVCIICLHNQTRKVAQVVKDLLQNGCEDLDDHCVVGSALQDDALMFCNPEASRVLDPDQGSQDLVVILGKTVVWKRFPPLYPIQKYSAISTCHTMYNWFLFNPTVSQCIPEGSGCRRQQLGSIGVIQHLLGSVLVLTNGLVLLLSAAHCHRPHSDCHLLVYLDAGFSAVCVLVLLSTALPKLQRYGLLVLQATPLHLSVAQVRLRLTEVPGVLSVHELHVWQLSDALMVASLHVHCPDGLNAAQCADLMGRTKAVLAAFGINHCTVQPEFIRSDAAAGGGSGRSLCSLRCGQECVEKLCCSPQVDKTSCPKTESPACVQPCSPAPHIVLQTDQFQVFVNITVHFRLGGIQMKGQNVPDVNLLFYINIDFIIHV